MIDQLAMIGRTCFGGTWSVGDLPPFRGPEVPVLRMPGHRSYCLSPPFCEGFRSLSTIDFLMAKSN